MNLVRAISLGGGGNELRGNESTGLICHVQLLILAIDCVFNIVVDNFLRDPLVVLILFICQVFFLIIGLIFYLMVSANQAMKQGIHEKLLRHHQVTIVLWTIYFSMLIWWYIWTLKRSWPSAGDHFSFSFSGSSDLTTTEQQSIIEVTTTFPMKFNVSDTIQSTMPHIAAITTLTKATTRTTTASTITKKPTTTTTRGPPNLLSGHHNDSTIEMRINDTTTPMTILANIKNQTAKFIENTTENNDTGSTAQSPPPLSSYKLISDTPSIFNEIQHTTKEEQEELEEDAELIDVESGPLAAALLSSDTTPKMSGSSSSSSSVPLGLRSSSPTMNSTIKHNVHSDPDTVTFFWSPGFIAVYAIERSVSLFFYVAYILGTLHIVNAHMMDEDGGGGGGEKGRRNKNNNLKTKSSRYDSPQRKYNSSNSPGYIESDSNNFDDNGDNFIRQLEDQDGDPFDTGRTDPFENAQYDYQYKNTYSLYPYSFNSRRPTTTTNPRRHHHSHHHHHSSMGLETSDGEAEEDASIRSSGTETDVRGGHGHGGFGEKSYNGTRKNKKGKKNVNSDRDFGARAKSAFKLKSTTAKDKISKTKGGLRNMMMMAELGNSNVIRKSTTAATLAGGDDEGEMYMMTAGDSSMLDNPVMSSKLSSSGVKGGRKKRMISEDNSTVIVTASTSVDSVAAGSGSTDELLVAELFTRGGGGSDNNNYYQTGNEAFDHDMESEESDGRVDYVTRLSPIRQVRT